MAPPQAAASAKSLVDYIYNNREASVTSRLVIKDAVAAAMKKRKADEEKRKNGPASTAAAAAKKKAKTSAKQ